MTALHLCLKNLPNDTRMLRIAQVMDRVGLSRATIYRRISEGNFPSPVNLGGQSVGWIEVEIMDWLRLKILQARGQSAA